jgi:DNA-binding HxlR family transcriptional regulator
MSNSTSGWKKTWDDLWEILGCKWTFHIIRLLSTGDHGFNEMKHELEGITATMLSRRLKQLEAAEFVSKTVIASSPPSTSYRLTDIGEELAGNLRCIEQIDGIDETIKE